MINIRKVVVLTTLLLSGLVSSASATVIVDTGPGPAEGGGWSLYDTSWLGAGFSLLNNTTLTDIYGWMAGVGTAHIGIYDDGGGLPGGELFSSQFTLESTNDWYGLSGLDWGLAAGDYWVTFEVRSDDSLVSGSMPEPSANPLPTAYRNLSSSSFSWQGPNSLEIGVLIEGTPVPEPSTFILLGAGLAGLGFVVRRRKKE
jgi:hypothetical protein